MSKQLVQLSLAKQRVAAVALLIATAAAYSSGLKNEFVGLDDRTYVVENPLVTQADGLWRIWATTESPQYYPLTFSTYWLEYRIWGAWPTGYLLTNLALHMLNALLVVALARALGLNDMASWIAGALFALHPAQVASVAWLAELKNTLSGLFSLIAMLAYLRSVRTAAMTSYALALLTFALALLSKTAVLTWPVSLLLVDVLVLRSSWVAAFRRSAPFFALSAAAAVITIVVEHLAPIAAPPMPQRLLAASMAIWFYLATLVAPLRLSPVYPLWSVDFSEWWWWVAAIGAVALAGVVLWRRNASHGRFGWGLTHFALLLAPALGVIPFGYLELSFVADHFLYLAAIGPLIFLTGLLPSSEKAPPSWLLAISLAVVAVLGVLTWNHVADYRDERTLFTRVFELDPRSAIANQKLGFLALQEQRYDVSASHYASLVAIRPNVSADRSDYAAALLQLGRIADAIEQLRMAIKLNPQDGMAHMNLGVALEQLNDLGGAEEALRSGARLLPQNANAHLYVAKFLAARDKLEDAEREFRESLKIDANGLDANSAFAEALLSWGRVEEARVQFRRAIDVAKTVGDEAAIKQLERRLRKIEQRP